MIEGDVDKGMQGDAKPLFDRAKTNAKLSDFKIQKMIGKGTFGKVY